jgi:hypothetical protein
MTQRTAIELVKLQYHAYIQIVILYCEFYSVQAYSIGQIFGQTFNNNKLFVHILKLIGQAKQTL